MRLTHNRILLSALLATNLGVCTEHLASAARGVVNSALQLRLGNMEATLAGRGTDTHAGCAV